MMERLVVCATFWTHVRTLLTMNQKVMGIYSELIHVVIPRTRGNAVNVYALIARYVIFRVVIGM